VDGADLAPLACLEELNLRGNMLRTVPKLGPLPVRGVRACVRVFACVRV
jgi:hypothetical protein